MHIIAIVIILLVPILCKFTGRTGLSLFGTCSFRVSDDFPVLGVLIFFVYVILALYTIFYFKKMTEGNEEV